MDEHIIRIHDVWYHWKMTIDLKDLAKIAGNRVREPDGTYTDPRTGEVEHYKGCVYTEYPMTKAKKLLKLIRKYGTEKEFRACDTYLAENAKLYKYWRELCES